MERVDFDVLDINEPAKASKNSKKRRWREIETIKERMRLRQELLSIDSTIEFDNEFDL
ncbi:DUF3545 family protein [Celerinatantimonas yamalensis]|uniref:DUF3545 family protein n=1 Tax=Celerinatantimonas yamalensis TaxID=559956 RepID=A0ABW9GAC7_9GAMM